MKRAIINIFIAAMFVLAAYSCTMDDIKSENDRNFTRDALLTVWMVKEIYPVGECDPRSQKENCKGLYMQTCNGHGQWENVTLCPHACTMHPDQARVECN